MLISMDITPFYGDMGVLGIWPYFRNAFFYPCPGVSPRRRRAHVIAQSYLFR